MSPSAHEATTGASAAAATLTAIGVDVAFCLPGEETIALLEAFDDANIELIVGRHEQHAAFMAATHGRLTGKPGVLVTTLGPGATNATTAVAHATLGGYPLLHIAGQKPLRDNREGSFQVLDLPSVARPVTKQVYRVTDPADVAAVLSDAYRTAAHGRPGGVFVELPTDIATGEIGDTTSMSFTNSVAGGGVVPADDAVDGAARLLQAARRPVVVVAGGAQHARISAALISMVDGLDLPVIALQTGLGVVPSDHRCALPPIAMHRPDAAHLALEDADLVITVGYDPVEHPPLAWNRSGADVIHVAEWPTSIQRGHSPVLELVGDPAATLDRLAAAGHRAPADCIDTYRAAIEQQLADEQLAPDDGPPVGTIEVVDALRAVLDDDDVVALDNGSYKLWFARHFDVRRPNGLLLDNALATMGAGLATAMEAARLQPDRNVVAVVGDGGFMMNVGDLETAVRLQLDNLTVVVLRDDTYGFIADHQRERGRSRIAVDLGNPDIVMLADAFGATGSRHDPDGDLTALLRVAVERRAVSVVDCPIDERADDLLRAQDSLSGARSKLNGG